MSKNGKSKGGSKVLTAIIAFLLGFILAIGAVVGICFYAVNADLDQLFSLVGFKNRDENNKQYINTDENNGGFKSALDVVNRLQTLAGNIGNVTVSELEVLFPALDGLTQQIYDMMDDYAEFDIEELESTKFMDLPEFINQTMMGIEPGELLETLGYADEMKENAIVWAIMAGIEAQYVYENNDKTLGNAYPVYYDEYVYEAQQQQYFRTVSVNSNTAYPSTLGADWLTESVSANADGETIYRQYYFPYTYEGTTYYIVTKRNDNDDFIFPLTGSSAQENQDKIYDVSGVGIGYGDEYQYLTGNFYYDNSGEKIKVDPVTVKSLTETPFQPLYYMPATDVIGDSDIVVDILSGTSIGEVMDKSVDLGDRVNSLEISSLVNVTPDSALLMYLAYNVTDVRLGEDGVYTGVYAKDTEEECNVTVTVENGKVSGVAYENGLLVGGVTVKNVSSQVDTIMDVLTVGDLTDIQPDNSVMTYLGYKISNLTAAEGGDYQYTASYDDNGTMVDCFVKTRIEEGKEIVDSVYYYDNSGATVTVPCTTVNGISEAVDNIKITAFIDVKASDAIMCYLGYGITDLVQADGQEYDYAAKDENGADCYVVVNDGGVVTSVYRLNGQEKEAIAGTTIDNVGQRVETLTDKLALSDVMAVYADDGNIMTFLAFSVTDVQLSDDGVSYTGVYHDNGTGTETTYPCTVNTVADGDRAKILSVTVAEQAVEPVKTRISGVSDQVNHLTDTLTIGELMGDKLDMEDKVMSKLAGYTIDNISSAIDDFELADLMDFDPDSSLMMYIGYNITDMTLVSEDETQGTREYTGVYNGETVTVSAEKTEDGTSYKVVSVTDANGEAVKGVTVVEVPAQINNITDNLTIGEIIDVGDNLILGSLGDKKLSELTTAIDELTLQQLYYNAIYIAGTDPETNESYAVLKEVVADESSVTDGEKQIAFDSRYIYYYKDESGALILVNDDATDATRGKLTAFDAAFTYYTYGECKGVWKILLCTDGDEALCTLKDLGNLMESAKKNIADATLFELAEAEIIDVDSLYSDDKQTPKTISYNNATVTLGDLKISDLIEIVSSLAN